MFQSRKKALNAITKMKSKLIGSKQNRLTVELVVNMELPLDVVLRCIWGKTVC